MNVSSHSFVHPDFKINGKLQNRERLVYLAESFINVGQEFENEIGNFILEWFDKNSHIEISTSGTTGQPKKIKIEKQAMVNSAIATATYFELKPKDKVLHCLPTRFIAGKMMLVRAIILGFDLDIVVPSAKPLENNQSIYGFAAMVPMQVENSITQLNQVKKLIIGGAKISNSLKEKIIEQSINAFETYGMTETITHIAVRKVGEAYFTVLPEVIISQDENNCLIINAPRISTETIKTNDLVKICNATQFEFIGRIDNVVNSGGVKLFPEQIEEKLLGKITSRFFVAGIQDEKLGEKLVLVVEGKKQNLDNSIFDELNKHDKPKKIIYIDNFIETENGKIKRKETLKKV